MNEKFVLALARAGKHNHLAPQAGGKVAAALNLVGRQRHIELEISRYPHSRRARLFQSLRIVQGLCINGMELAVSFAHDTAYAQGLAQRMIGKERDDKHPGNPKTPCSRKKI